MDSVEQFRLPKIMVTGSAGQLGFELVSMAREAGFDVVALTRQDLDVTDAGAVMERIAAEAPGYLINAAGFNDPDQAETRPEECMTVNRNAVAHLVEACRAHGVALIQFSTDAVFDGNKSTPYGTHDVPHPLSVYGKSKWESEQIIRRGLERFIILRLGWVFSALHDNFALRVLAQARTQSSVSFVNDQIGNPTAATDVARVVLAIIKQLDSGANVWGKFHYCGSESVSWYGFAEAILAAARQFEDLRVEEMHAVQASESLQQAPRPAYSVLDCGKLLGCFGIRQYSWRPELLKVIRRICQPSV